MSTMTTRSQKAYDLIRARIESGEYSPGQRLKIRELGLSMNSSDIPVREAIQRLSAEGYISYTPHIGAVVTRIPLDEVLELLLTYAVLEGTVVRLAAAHISPAMLERLQRIVDEQRAAAGHDDAEQFAQLDRQFHYDVMSACPTRALIEVATSVKERIDRQKPFLLLARVPNRLEHSVHEHQHLLEMLGERPLPLDRIEAAARQHKLSLLVRLASDELASEARRAHLLAGQPGCVVASPDLAMPPPAEGPALTGAPDDWTELAADLAIGTSLDC
jgi:DNA-binding GntR family transcriptional regulator